MYICTVAVADAAVYCLDQQINNKFIEVIHNPLNPPILDLPGVAAGGQV